MRLRELKKEVYSLSFIPAEESSVRFINAVRRALSIIFCELKVTGKRTLVIGKDIIQSITSLHHTGGETVALPLVGRAYAVKLSGKGSFSVQDGPLSSTKDFDADEVSFKGFIRYGGKIEFTGDHAYDVISLVSYADTLSERIEDIPSPEDSPIIDMSKYPDFFAFCAPPTDSRGNDIRGAIADGARVILPPGYKGKITVRYRKRPLLIRDDEEELIDLPDAYIPLLAPLSAALMLLDDDKDLSDCYMELYSRMAEDMKRNSDPCDVKQVRTNGWA